MIDCTEEGERLRRLAELALVEAPVDPLMERVCALACRLLDMPVSFVNILDATQAHIKAHRGHAHVSIPREIAFCDIAIRSDEPLVVPNLASDPRFAENPLVVDAPHVRFYAGIPLVVAPGVRIGALCVADLVPRDLTDAQVECLQGLAELVLGQIRHHAARQTLARQAIELARKERILAQTARLAGVGGFELDPVSGTLTPSDELRRLLGQDELATLDQLLSRLETSGHVDLREAIERLAAVDGELDTEISLTGGDGAIRHLRFHAEATSTPAGCRVVGIVQDITEHKRATGEMEWLATHDGLTRICNRAAFIVRAEAALRRADASASRVALIILDVDRFKAINDTHGHDVGDRVLVAVADRLVATVGRRGTVARLGGDEFGILLGSFEAEGAVAAVAADLLAALRQPFVHEGHELGTRATLGIALSGESACPTSLLKDADIALYEAKAAGRDGFALFRTPMREALESRLGRLAASRCLVAETAIEPWGQKPVAVATRRGFGRA